ncbi:MAG: ComF family protein [Bacteroidota bacterium]
MGKRWSGPEATKLYGVKRITYDFINLFYPNVCSVCHDGLSLYEEVLCTSCLYHIPRTRFWNWTDNPVSQIFWGRVNVEHACSFFFFRKGSRYRKLLHMLKYQGRDDIGVFLGRQFGLELRNSDLYKPITAIVPVPLHPKRLKERGYNQAEVIAKGLSEAMGVPVVTDVLLRNVYTQTQTKKSRIERMQNIAGAFTIKNAEKIEKGHVLLVDDVITTGATLETCAQTLLDSVDVKVSVGTIAYATNV